MGRREKVFVGSILGAIAVTHFFVFYIPRKNKEKYKAIQSQTRQGIVQENVQPGNMKVWSDPFDRDKKSTKES